MIRATQLPYLNPHALRWSREISLRNSIALIQAPTTSSYSCYHEAMTIFQAQHIDVIYHRNGVPYEPFSDISFSLEAGCLYNLMGPSGSGKSTLLSACARMLPRTRGTLMLNGVPEADIRPNDWRRRVCLVPQAASLIPGTVRENLLFPWTLKIHDNETPPSDEELTLWLSRAMLDDISLDQAASQLSGGQQARVALLRAFVTKPNVLLLDEVEAALDDESAAAIGKLTYTMLDERTTCLRIRHRADDGYAFGTFTLSEGALTYTQHEPTEHNARHQS